MPAAANGFYRGAQACAIVAPEAVKIEAVNKVSGLRKFGVVARVAGEQAGRNRVLSAVMGAVRTTGRSFGRAAHQLWLEVTGLIFLVMSLSFAAAAVKDGTLKPGDTSIKAGSLNKIEVKGDNVLLGTPFTFTKENIDGFDF